jgi:hypothetical protein
MVALERPFIATGWDCGLQNGAPICLQYGSVTHLYTLPYVPRDEQVSMFGFGGLFGEACYL